MITVAIFLLIILISIETWTHSPLKGAGGVRSIWVVRYFFLALQKDLTSIMILV